MICFTLTLIECILVPQYENHYFQAMFTVIIPSFIGKVGGTLGLMTLSFVSSIEFVEFFI